MKKYVIKIISPCLTLCFIGSVFAQGVDGTLVTVNGAKITASQLDQFVSMAISQGGKDTPQLRQDFLNDLIVREVISQDVKKTRLLSKGNNALKVKIAEQDAIMNLWFAQYFSEHPISEVDVRSEYEKQASAARDPKNSKEYLISQIVLATQGDAQRVIDRLKQGESFALLAKNESIDKVSSQNDGVVGWVLPSQITPAVGDLLVTLSNGGISPSPVQVGSAWYVVRVDAVKPFSMPSFDQAKAKIAQSMIQSQRSEAIRKLMKTADINKAK